MIKAIEINGKTLKPAELDFNAICDMEDLGVSIFDADNKGLSSLRAYLAITMHCGITEAGNELTEHLAKGGSLDGLAEAFAEAVKDSTFFRNAAKTTEKKTSKAANKEA